MVEFVTTCSLFTKKFYCNCCIFWRH